MTFSFLKHQLIASDFLYIRHSMKLLYIRLIYVKDISYCHFIPLKYESFHYIQCLFNISLKCTVSPFISSESSECYRTVNNLSSVNVHHVIQCAMVVVYC